MSGIMIVRDGATGEAVVAGSDFSVSEILLELADEESIERVVRGFPGLSREGVIAAVEFAVNAVHGERPFGRPGYVGAVREPRAEFGEEEESIEETLGKVANEHARLLYEMDLLDGIREGLEQIEAGLGIPHEQVFAELRAKYGR